MKALKKLSDRQNFVAGFYGIGLGIVSYLVDCAIAPERVDHLSWLARGVYAWGPFGFIITLPFLIGGFSAVTYFGLKLLFKKEPIQLPETTRGK